MGVFLALVGPKNPVQAHVYSRNSGWSVTRIALLLPGSLSPARSNGATFVPVLAVCWSRCPYLDVIE